MNARLLVALCLVATPAFADTNGGDGSIKDLTKAVQENTAATAANSAQVQALTQSVASLQAEVQQLRSLRPPVTIDVGHSCSGGPQPGNPGTIGHVMICFSNACKNMGYDNYLIVLPQDTVTPHENPSGFGAGYEQGRLVSGTFYGTKLTCYNGPAIPQVP